MKLTNGAKYSADITLGWIKSIASNDDVKAKLESYGFKDVVVTG